MVREQGLRVFLIRMISVLKFWMFVGVLLILTIQKTFMVCQGTNMCHGYYVISIFLKCALTTPPICASFINSNVTHIFVASGLRTLVGAQSILPILKCVFMFVKTFWRGASSLHIEFDGLGRFSYFRWQNMDLKIAKKWHWLAIKPHYRVENA